MSTKTKVLGLDFERDYVKAIRRRQREEVGLRPAFTHRNRKKYSRQDSRREERDMVSECL